MNRQLRSQYHLIQQTLAELTYETYLIHCHWIEYAQQLAQIAGELGEIPVGAVITNPQGKLIAAAANRKIRQQDATAHAEIIAIRAASKTLENCYLPNCTLYVTLEPCPMCAGAILQSRLNLLVYGTDDPKTGAIRTVTNLPDSYCSNHRLKVIAGIRAESCRQQLQTWFRQRRNQANQANVSGQ